MPKIFDNIQNPLLPELVQTLQVAYRADFCVGYFNLRGWRELDARIDEWTGGEGAQVRLLIGMHQSPQDAQRRLYRFGDDDAPLDNQTANRLKKELAAEFREQLTRGAPTNADEAGRGQAGDFVEDGVEGRVINPDIFGMFLPDP